MLQAKTRSVFGAMVLGGDASEWMRGGLGGADGGGGVIMEVVMMAGG